MENLLDNETSLFMSNKEKMDIIRTIIFRFSEKIIVNNEELLTGGDKEKIVYIVNNNINNYVFNPEFRTIPLLSENGYSINFLQGSAISKINKHADVINLDIDEVVKLYIKEATIFVTELKNTVRPTIIKLIEGVEVEKQLKLVTTKNRYDLKLLDNVELFDTLEENGKLGIIGNGTLPATLKLSFFLDADHDNFRELFITNDEVVDSSAAEFLNGVSEEDMRTFWNKYMLNISTENSSLNALYSLHFRKLDDLILLTLAMRRILAGNVNLVSNLDVLQANKVNLLDMINTLVVKYNTFINFNKDIKLLIDFKVDEKDTDIYLSRSEYNNYLDLGGDIDNVIGYVIKMHKEKGLTFATKEKLLEEGVSYSKFYTEKTNLDKLLVANMNNTNIKNLWLTYVTRILYELDKVKGTLIKFNPYDVESTIRDYLDNINADDIMDTNRIIMDIINIVSPEVSKFIRDMNSLANMNGDDTLAKEASFYAVINRLTTLILKDVVAKKVL